ncbi:PilZ domain-containing protein [Aeromonas sp. RU39B]|uniref:PilZ domain-containing protein n=1 Tax=Aeromonas sp. RU39B TaxID=1907416 RepID=UPI000954549D|nr:PilZ domain-containing protein [Aeromonas sp. RU39B]SIR49540.1 PilZ domain-containing protein [Aeromonas sp. RU39B]
MERDIDHSLLEQLIPLLREPDFDELFERITHNESTNQRFLLKMEIKRLCTPCQRVIDLRDHFADDCEVVIYQGITHMMPADANALFRSHCYLYRDQYTLGVYEALMAWQSKQLRIRNEERPLTQPDSPLRQYDVRRVPFASYYGRREERMHFSSPVLLKLASGERIFARTSDLSVGGIRVLVPHLPAYQTGDEVEVHFTGLEHDFPDPVLYRSHSYQILGEESRDDRIWLRLVKMGENTELESYLHQFIENNKSRYRISVDYLLSAAVVKGYEQFYLPRMSGLPLFFATGDAPNLEIVLKTENNQPILEYWRDEKNRDMLAGLFPALRMQALLRQSSPLKETLLYCFTHTVRSHIYFFSASREELQQTGLRDLFFQVGSRRASWRVFRLTVEACHPVEADASSLLPSEISPQQDMLLQQRLAQFGYVGLLQQIDNELTHTDYQVSGPSDRNANDLQIFGHAVSQPLFEVESLHYIQLRRERRYSHKTAVAIRHDDKTHIGWTRDISTHGLQVELEEGLPCSKNDVITLSLPRLQELSKSLDLRNLPYRVVNCNAAGTVLHLCIEGHPDLHTGRLFFTKLIESNQDKLKAVREGRRYRGLARCLRNLFTHHLFNPSFYVNKGRTGVRVAAVGRSPQPRTLDSLLGACAERPQFDNLAPLLQGELQKALVLTPLRHRQREEPPLEQEVYVHLWHDDAGLPHSESQPVAAFPDATARRRFVEDALINGQFFSIRVTISRTGRPDTNFIANELDYIAKFAIHKAKQLEEELWSVVGVGDLIDTTAATLFALGLNPAAVTAS